MTDPYTEATALFPVLARYKKLCVALLGTTAPFVIFLTSGSHSPQEIVAASVGYVLTNFGVAAATNKP